MSRCLSDRNLLSLHVGGGTTSQQAHADQCDACAARATRLRRDVRQIAAVLRESPAPRAAAPAASRRAWPAVAAGLALATGLLGAPGGRWPAPPAPSTSRAVETAEATRLLQDMSMAMFSIGGDPAPPAPDALAEPGSLLDGEAGCEPGQGFDVRCGGAGVDVTL